MRRVYLWEPGTGRVSLPLVRRAAVELATWAVDGPRGRSVGDPVHEWVTEGRRKQYETALAKGAAWAVRMTPYSSCGDLWHWLLMLLGCRDERVVNRGDDGGIVSWAVGDNLGRLIKTPWYVTWGEPELGDLLHVSGPDHAAVLLERTTDDQWVTADYGQPYGKRKDCPVRPVWGGGRSVRGRRLAGWVSLARLVAMGGIVESAIVPDSFVGGVVDDNPYPEDLRVPEGV